MAGPALMLTVCICVKLLLLLMAGYRNAGCECRRALISLLIHIILRSALTALFASTT